MWLIITTNRDEEVLYWSNEWGWTSIEEATLFTNEEKQYCSLPRDGTWVRA